LAATVGVAVPLQRTDHPLHGGDVLGGARLVVGLQHAQRGGILVHAAM
jgi:hypothetical protein